MNNIRKSISNLFSSNTLFALAALVMSLDASAAVNSRQLVLGNKVVANIVHDNGMGPAEKYLAGFSVAAPKSVSRLDELYSWCADAIITLQAYREDALQAADRLPENEKYIAANRILQRGLAAALASYNDEESTYTRKAIQRGLLLAQYLDYGTDNRNEEAIFEVLNEYYNFVITEVNSLDMTYYSSRRPYCDRELCLDFDTLLKNAKRFATSQIDFLQSQFLYKLSAGGRKAGYGTVGLPSNYLRAAELITAHAALDLMRTVNEYESSCEITALVDLSMELQRFNRGERFGIKAEERAKVNDTANTLDVISRTLGSMCAGS